MWPHCEICGAVKPHLKAKFAYNLHPDFTVKILEFLLRIICKRENTVFLNPSVFEKSVSDFFSFLFFRNETDGLMTSGLLLKLSSLFCALQAMLLYGTYEPF